MDTENLLSARLDQLEAEFRKPLPHRRPWEATSGLLAARGFELRRAVELLDNHPTAAMVITRALADLTILTLWIELCPKLHTVLWASEGDRLAERDSDALVEFATSRGRTVPPNSIASPAARGRIARANERYRKIARVAGIRISPKPGEPLIPNVRERVRLLPVSELEMYSVAFGVGSAWTHAVSYTMGVEFVVEGDGIYAIPRSSVRPEVTRRFALALQAGQYAAVSRIAGLGIDAELDLIRQAAMQAE